MYFRRWAIYAWTIHKMHFIHPIRKQMTGLLIASISCRLHSITYNVYIAPNKLFTLYSTHLAMSRRMRGLLPDILHSKNRLLTNEIVKYKFWKNNGFSQHKPTPSQHTVMTEDMVTPGPKCPKQTPHTWIAAMLSVCRLRMFSHLRCATNYRFQYQSCNESPGLNTPLTLNSFMISKPVDAENTVQLVFFSHLYCERFYQQHMSWQFLMPLVD